MTMKVQFDPLNIAGTKLAEAVTAICKDAEITFHNSRERAEKPKEKKS